ncbi:MAG TPA: GAF domain-containing sensor histidine kinase [Thermoflexia bacterium]|nr:GAF domain-containing sensor histidine kinase [Thermoflexia bacterium]
MEGTFWPYVVALGVWGGLAHLILLLLLVFRRDGETPNKLARAYLGLSLVWIAAVAFADLEALFLPVVTDTAELLLPVLVTSLMLLETLLACSFLDAPALPAIAAAGGTWCVILFGAAVYLAVQPTPDVPLREAAVGGWGVLGLVQVGLAIRGLARSRLALHRNRALYWLLIAIPLTGGQAATLMPFGPWRGVGPLLHLLGAVALSRGVLSLWLPNVVAFLRSILRFLFLATVTAAMLVGIVLGAEALRGRFPPTFPPMVPLILLAGAAALIYLPLYRVLTRLADRLLEGVGFDPAQALQEYSQTIGAILNLEQLASVAVGTVAEVLGVQRGALLVATEAERGGLLLRPVPGQGEIPEEPVELEPISPILARIRDEDKPLFQYEVEHHPALREAPAREREWLRNLEMEVYLPIRSQEGLVGLLALGAQRGGEPYSPREVQFLSTLAHQTAVALQNARLVEGLQALNRRITQLHENLRAAYERLARLDKAKADFLAIASHELRTPLAQVRGYVDVLADLAESGVLTQEQIRRIAENISRPTRRLENIISAMLDATQIDTEGLALHFAPTTIALIIRLALEPWLSALKERNLTLTTQGLEDIPPIQADMERLTQAFSNLISNAIKFTPDGGKIAIEAHPLDEEHFEVTVADTGIGISKTDQELIFEKFYRVGSASLHSSGEFKFKGGGPGLGLPIARGVIEGHGGCIWVESEGYDEERCPGSTFHVVLPYRAHRGPCRWRRPAEAQPAGDGL